MYNTQPDSVPASTFFNSLFPTDSSHVLSETGIPTFPETTPCIIPLIDASNVIEEQDTVTLPTLRLPQVSPATVIATRQRSISSTSNVHLHSITSDTTFSSGTSCPHTERPGGSKQEQGEIHRNNTENGYSAYQDSEYITVALPRTALAPLSMTSQAHQSSQTPRPDSESGYIPLTPRFEGMYVPKSVLSGVTYIPRSMQRHTQPTVLDAVIACGTLVLLFFCLLLFLYFIGI